MKRLTEKEKNQDQNPSRQSIMPILKWPRGPIQWQTINEINLPRIRIYGDGISINNIKLPVTISSLPSSKLGLLLGLITCLPKVVLGQTQNNYYEDLKGTIYKLFLSGVEDLTSAVDALNNGRCEGLNTTTTIPDDFELIQDYYPHSGNAADIPAASLFRDKLGVTNQTIVDCISGRVEDAHKEWETERFSLKSIFIIVGSFLAFVILAGLMVYLCNRKMQCFKKKNNVEEVEDNSDNEEEKAAAQP